MTMHVTVLPLLLLLLAQANFRVSGSTAVLPDGANAVLFGQATEQVS